MLCCGKNCLILFSLKLICSLNSFSGKLLSDFFLISITKTFRELKTSKIKKLEIKKFQVETKRSILDSRRKRSPVRFTREPLGQIIFYFIFLTNKWTCWSGHVDQGTGEHVRQFTSEHVDQITGEYVGHDTDELVGLTTSKMLTESLVNILTKALVNMLAKSLVKMLPKSLTAQRVCRVTC